MKDHIVMKYCAKKNLWALTIENLMKNVDALDFIEINDQKFNQQTFVRKFLNRTILDEMQGIKSETSFLK
jgi:hypothetical protein